MESLRETLRKAASFDELFKAVKSLVEKRLGIRRAGLGLVLADLPLHIAGFTAIGTNSIVLNKQIIEAIKAISTTKEEFNSYVFTVLLHEYLHTLGFDEQSTRAKVKELVEQELGREHIASKLASKSPYELYPILDYLRASVKRGDDEVIIVKDFDTDSITYIR